MPPANSCPNHLDMYGVYGNASEWVLDHLDKDHSWCKDGCTDPAPREGELAVLKGGAVNSTAEQTRVSYRYTQNDNTGSNTTGLRCVRSPISFE